MPKHPDNDKFLSVHVPFQVPDFVAENHEKFIEFLQAYFEYLELLGRPAEIITNLENYVDVDNTTEEFLNLFKEQYLHDIPNKTLVSKDFLVKRIREFYRARGTEKSFQFLFRILFNEEITIDTPKDDILKPSDGDWRTDQIIKTENKLELSKFFGKKITGQQSNATAIVENIVSITENIFDVAEIALSNISGNFIIGESVTTKDFETGETLSFVVGGMLVSAEVEVSGSNYKKGDFLIVSGGGGKSGEGRILNEDASGIIIKEDNTDLVTEEDFGVNMIASVGSIQGGTIDGFKINTEGTGYTIGDEITINDSGKLFEDGSRAKILVSDVSGSISSIKLTNSGQNYLEEPQVFLVGGDSVLHEDNSNIILENGIDFIVPEDSKLIAGKIKVDVIGGEITSFDVNRPGTNYRVGDKIEFFGNPGSTNGIAKVSAVNEIENIISESGDIIKLEDDIFQLISEQSSGINAITIVDGGGGFKLPPESIISSDDFGIRLEDNLGSILLDMDQVEPYKTGTNSKLFLEASFGSDAIISPNGWGRLDNLVFETSLPEFRGSNYISQPHISFKPFSNSGSGATATATITKFGQGGIIELNIENKGFNYKELPTASATNIGDGNASITLTTNSIGGIETVLINRPGFNATKDPIIDASKVGDGKAKIKGKADALFSPDEGFWKGTKSFLSHDKYLQDNNFYQIYSYVINHGGQTLNFWRDVVLRLLHPAGYNLFSQIDILSELELSLFTMSIRGPSGKPDFHDLPGEPDGPGEDATIILRLLFNVATKLDTSISRTLPDPDVKRPDELVFVPGTQSDNLIQGETITFPNGVTAKVSDITPRGTFVTDVFLPKNSNIILEGGNNFLTEQDQETVLESSVVQVEDISEIIGLVGTGQTSGTTFTILRPTTPTQYTITRNRSLGSTWKTLDYQKFMSSGGYSNLSETTGRINVENAFTRERLRLDGNRFNGNSNNQIFDPLTQTFELAGCYLLENGNGCLTTEDDNQAPIPFGDGEFGNNIIHESEFTLLEDNNKILSEDTQKSVLEYINNEDEKLSNEDGGIILFESNVNSTNEYNILEDEKITKEDGSITLIESNIDPVSDFNITEDEIITNENGDTMIAENGDRFVTQESNSRISYEDGNIQLNETSILGTKDGLVEENSCILFEDSEKCMLNEGSILGTKDGVVEENLPLVYEDGSKMLNERSFVTSPSFFVLDIINQTSLEQISVGGTYRINNFKNIYLNSIINPDGTTKSNYRERRTSESYVNLIKS